MSCFEFYAALASMIGLVITIGAGMFTFSTWWNVQTLVTFKKRRHFLDRLSEHDDELQQVPRIISDVAYRKFDVDQAIFVLATLQKICENIKELDRKKLLEKWVSASDIDELVGACKRAYSVSQNKKLFQDQLKTLYPKVSLLISGIKVFRENLQAEASDGIG